MNNRVGQQFGNYRLLHLLGRGGFADVYLGEHRYLKSAAALKILRISLSEKNAQRFLEEAQTLARLRHINILRVLDFAIERDTPVLIMDYIPGGSLRERHPRGTSLPLHMTVDYVEQIAAALQYAHNQDIIHRDVKPENILLDTGQRLVLSDFGLALLTSSPDWLSTQELAGTIPYIAPEQVEGKPRFASDQYALGVLAYEWITGERPFKGATFEVIDQHLKTPPPPLRKRRPDLPATAEQVVLKALAKDPSKRYSSVTAFAHALKRSCLDGTEYDKDSDSTAPLEVSPRSSARALDHSRLSRPTLGKVFLSVAPGDESVVERLVEDLKQRGVHLSNDFSEKISEEALRQAVRSAHRVVVVVTPQTRSSRLVREHLHLAQVYQRRLVLVWMQGEEMATLLPDQIWKSFRLVDVVDAREERYQIALEELLVCLREETPLPPSTTETDIMTLEELPEPRNPYKGLRAFRQDEATDFFGREALIAGMVEELKSILVSVPPSWSRKDIDSRHLPGGKVYTPNPNEPSGSALETERRGATETRLLAMVGPSGSGKSSAMVAGLLPQLQMGALPGSKAWVYLEPIVPGPHPLEALALTLAPHFPGRAVKAIREDLQDDSTRGLHRLSTQLAKRPDSRVVLIIDQFEELFTQTIAQEEQRNFIDLLVTAVTEAHGPVLVLLTLRADFYDRPMRYPHLYRLIEAHHQSLLPMEIHELHQAIERPADLPDVQLTFEGNLLGDLLFEAQGQVGALPLLEFTLDQLFQQRDGHTLTMAAYREIGGVKGALVKHAESTYAALPSDEHRSFARVLFMRLVNLGMTDQDTTRRRATLPELSLPDAKQTERLREVTDTFIAARLLTTNEHAGITTIEVSHEALIGEWERFSNWLREGREDIRFQQAISNDVDAWEQRRRPKDRLYHGSRLKEARAWARRNKPSKQEDAFLRASALRRMQSVVSVIVIFLLLVTSVGAAVWFFLLLPPDPTIVTNLNDDGPGSLRWDIGRANAGSTIKFTSGLQGTMMLKSNLVFSRNLTIQGSGASALTISSGNSGNVVQVLSGHSVTMSGLSFKDSDTRKAEKSFLYNQGDLKIRNTIISGNTSSVPGGGIYNENMLTISNTTISGNKSSDHGGGIHNANLLTLRDTTISGNTSSRNGGGINNEKTLTLIDSTVSDNSAQYGGGIANYNGMLIVTTSTISGNKATAKGASGGGILLDSSKVTLTTSTISGNVTDDTGGGITVSGSQAAITFCTIHDNTAQDGGGLSIQNAQEQQSHVEMENSIVAGNHAPVEADVAGTLTSDGYNLIQDASQASLLNGNSPPTDLLRMSPNLSLLQNNHGPTETHALAPGSPAIDRVPLEACHLDTLPTDQRGVRRPQGSACDIGAYEYEEVPPH